MSANSSTSKDVHIVSLYREFATGRISRRDFMRRAAALGVAGAAAATRVARPAPPMPPGWRRRPPRRRRVPLDVAEWSYMWVNVKRADTARGSFVGGQQMYVEYMVPAQVRQPFPIVLVHGGGGQGTDWMGTPDGRPGWFQYLVPRATGSTSSIVRGTAARRCIPICTAASRPTPVTLESLAGRFTPPARQSGPGAERVSEEPHPVAGPGQRRLAGSRSARRRPGRQLRADAAAPGAAGRQGGAPGCARRRPGGRGGAPAGPPQAANARPAGQLNVQHIAWRQAGADLLDKIGRRSS